MQNRLIYHSLNLLVILLALAGASFITGCSSDKGANLMPGPNAPIADVPIPYGFNIDLSQSQSTYVPKTNLRVINQLYKGSDPRLSVARFYMTNMPTSGWKLQQQVQNPQAITETFTKGPETCTIAVKHSWWHTLIYVTIVPTEGPSTGSPTAPMPGSSEPPVNNAPTATGMPAAPAGGS